MKNYVASLIVVLGSVFAVLSVAQGTAFTYQGALQQNGTPYTGSAEMQFTLWDALSGGTAMATNSPASVVVGVTNGLFTVSPDFGAGAFPGAERWLQIDVRTAIGPFTTLTPRQKVTAAPYAIRSREAAGVPAGAITTGMIAPGAVTDTQLSGITAAGKVANSATTAASTNAAGAIVARDASGNFAASGVSIEAGTSIAALSVVGTRDGFFGTPLGLFQNLNMTGNSGPALRVVNEGGNSIDGALSVSASGTGDIAVFGNASVFVSRLDTNGIWSAHAFEATERLKAGSGHALSGIASSILGGFNNAIRANYSSIGGGGANSIGTDSIYQVIGGGLNNAIGTNSSFAVIGGGRDNSIGSNTVSAVVPGGQNNAANADFSFAAGRAAKANHMGAFVWGDSTPLDFPSTAANQFSVRAGGGARIVTSGAGMTLDGQPVLAGTVGTASLADNSVTTSKIADSAVTSAKLADSSVASLKLADNAVTASKLADNTVTSAKIVDGSVATAELADGAVASAKLGTDSVSSAKIADGTILPADLSLPGFDAVFWRASGNAGTTAGTHFLGTTDNQALEFKVNGLRVLRLEPKLVGPNVIGGHPANLVSNGVEAATIAGGGSASSLANRVAATGGTVGGGIGNLTEGAFSTIAGGRFNRASGSDSAVGGGSSNMASGTNSALGGGFLNIANGAYATVPGGRENVATNYALAAGRRAKANHIGSFVWGDSTDADFASTTTNQVRLRATGGMEVVGGSSQPALRFSGARIGGFGTPVGFAENTNTGGQSAPALRVLNNGGDSIDGALSVSAQGTGFIATFGNSSSFVSRLSINGTWTALAFNTASDRNAKENFAPVNTLEVLEKVAALPMSRWNYKAAPAQEHVGPVAQDFHAAFGLNGDDDKHIATVDADGVALAAIQGLNQKLEQTVREKDAEIQALKKQLAGLEKNIDEREARLARLEKAVEAWNGKRPVAVTSRTDD